jgi:hypothetical protein
VNLFHFMALQLVLFRSVGRRQFHPCFPWLALSLLLACRTIFAPVGGIFDFRFDFSAACLYGIWVCLILDSKVFRTHSYWVAAAAALLVTTRAVAALYVAGVSLGLLACLMIERRHAAPGYSRAVAVLRLRHAAKSFAAAGFVSLLILLPALKGLYEKYIVAHLLTDEKTMRAKEVGVESLGDYIFFYPKSLLIDHLGPATVAIGLGALLFATVLLVRDRPAAPLALRLGYGLRLQFATLVLATVVPLILLTADPSKSPVVADIAVVPVILLATYLTAALCVGPKATAALPILASPRWRTPGLGLVLLVIGIGAFFRDAVTDQHVMPRLALDRVNIVNDRIVRYALENDLTKPRFSIDRIVDYLFPGTLDVAAVEHFGAPLHFRSGLGFDKYGFDGAPRDAALKIVHESDIIVLTDPVLDRDAPYPMNAKIGAYWDELAAWTKQNRSLLISAEIQGIPYQVFVKPLVTLQGISAGWITNSGITIKVGADDLNRWPVIVFTGEINTQALGGVPHPRALAVAPIGGAGAELPATLKQDGPHYEIAIDARSLGSQSASPVKIALTFDRFFVPKDIGISSDTRKLVVQAPQSKELVAPGKD